MTRTKAPTEPAKHNKLAVLIEQLQRGEQIDAPIIGESDHSVTRLELVPGGTSLLSAAEEAAEFKQLDQAALAAAKKVVAAVVSLGSAVQDLWTILHKIQSLTSKRGSDPNRASIPGFPNWSAWLDSFIERSGIAKSRSAFYRRFKDSGAPVADKKPAEPRIQISNAEKIQLLKTALTLNRLLLALHSGGDVRSAFDGAMAVRVPTDRIKQLLGTGPADLEGSVAEPHRALSSPIMLESHQATPILSSERLPELPQSHSADQTAADVAVSGFKAKRQLAKVLSSVDMNFSVEEFAKQIAFQFAEANPNQSTAERDDMLREVCALLAENLGAKLSDVFDFGNQPGPVELPRAGDQLADQTPGLETDADDGYTPALRSWPERLSSPSPRVIRSGDCSGLIQVIEEACGPHINSAISNLSVKDAAAFAEKYFATTMRMYWFPRFGAETIGVKVEYLPVKPTVKNGQRLNRTPENRPSIQ